MKYLTPTILALAVIAPSINALDVADADAGLKLGLKLQLQIRAQKAWASDVNGATYDIVSGTTAQPDSVDFYLRRARIGFQGSWGDYKFAYILRNDDQDKNGTARTPVTNVAYVERIIKTDNFEHSIRAGLDYAFFNGASAVFSSTSQLLVSARPTDQAAMLAPRGVGVGYKLSTPRFTVGIDIQNNTGDDTNADTGNTLPAANANAAFPRSAGADYANEGLFIGARIQGILFDSTPDKPHMKPVESFVGATGTGLLASLEVGQNNHDNFFTGFDINGDGDTGDTVGVAGSRIQESTALANSAKTKALGCELLFHHDGLTALAEYRICNTKTKVRTDSAAAIAAGAGADYETDRRIWLVQAGYAMPVGDKWVEPAVRFVRIDLDDDNRESTGYGSASDYGSSGYQTEVGVNYYLNKTSNKLGLAFQHWRGEQSSSKADVVRAQWQLTF